MGKHADIHLTHTLFQKTNNNNIVTKDDGTLLNETTIEADGKPMKENNLYTFIDERAVIDGITNKCEIGPNIYVGQRTKIGAGNKLSKIYIGPDCELNTPWNYRPNKLSKLNQMKLSEFFQGKTIVHVGYDDSNEILMKQISDNNDLVIKIKELLGFDATVPAQKY